MNFKLPIPPGVPVASWKADALNSCVLTRIGERHALIVYTQTNKGRWWPRITIDLPPPALDALLDDFSGGGK